jgi:hypothetical protein
MPLILPCATPVGQSRSNYERQRLGSISLAEGINTDRNVAETACSSRSLRSDPGMIR